MFKTVSSRVSFPDMEKRILEFWKERDIFRRTETEMEGRPLFMLYEGPPTANGSPGIHHVLARAFKDIIPRYKTMKGYRCVRKGGWDTHGLPVELEVEKELGFSTKRDIEEYGIEKFNQKCRESVFRYVKEWEEMTDRIGFWVDMDDPYVTLDNDYIETGWWILRSLWDKGRLYQDMKGAPHCPRCVTSLSSHEVALGYKENTPDPSVFVKFRVTGWDDTRRAARAFNNSYERLTSHGEDVYFLAWTTTPWTLPGNTALAVDASAEYSLVQLESGEKLVLASALLSAVVQEPYVLLETFAGRELVALTYEPLYDASRYGVEISSFQASEDGGTPTLQPADNYQPTVIDASFVSMSDGSGIVHLAPAFGDEDLQAGRYHGLAFVQQVDLHGTVTGSYPFAGKFVKDADEDIMADLTERGLLHRREIYRHTYPFCWRCDTPLLYYAKPSWYIRTSAEKDRLISGNQEINWRPDYIKEGRFGEWLRNNVDWAISRERFWGSPIPIWRCDNCGHTHCVGSVQELQEMAVNMDAGSAETLDLHRPYVDRVLISCPNCDGTMTRVPEVIDCWFDSGSMPFAQAHYPFDGEEALQDGRFPADYICEAVDQTRGWFYTLHALSTLITGGPSYKNVICLGLILDAKGRKMSKSTGNVVNPWSVLDKHGADATRWYLYTSAQPGDSRRFSEDLVGDTVRRFLLTLWNVYSFFTTYAAVDKFHPDQVPADWKPQSELDRWLMSELDILITQVDSNLEQYNPTDAGRRIQEFVDRLSNWYVRRSRRRFWRSEGDSDKLSGYAALYTCLSTLCKLMAPFTPFIADEMYQNLVRSVDADAPESVHLAAFPQPSAQGVDQELMDATRLAMRVSSMGRGARSRAGIKVRQPLAGVLVKSGRAGEEQWLPKVEDQILDELNVKQLRHGDAELADELHRKALAAAGDPQDSSSASHVEAIVQVDGYWAALEGGYMVAIDSTITPELASEGLARELIHRIQNLRRSAGLEITDRIVAYYQGPDVIQDMLEVHEDYVREETLADQVMQGEPPEGAHSESGKLEGKPLVLAVRKV